MCGPEWCSVKPLQERQDGDGVKLFAANGRAVVRDHVRQLAPPSTMVAHPR